VQVPTLAAAWRLTGDARYAAAAGRHLRAWFLDPRRGWRRTSGTRRPFHGITTGRPQGVIDTLHLVEVARAIEASTARPPCRPPRATVCAAGSANTWPGSPPTRTRSRSATPEQPRDLLASPGGRLRAPRERPGADGVGTGEVQDRHRARPGGGGRELSEELRRTKPYGYSLFNLEALAGVAQTLSTKDDDLWTFELADGRGLRRALAYNGPYIRDKKTWTKPPDVMYDAEWPRRQSSLLFGGLALGHPEYVALWKTLPADSTVEEVVRNSSSASRCSGSNQPQSAASPQSGGAREGVSGGPPPTRARVAAVRTPIGVPRECPPEIKTLFDLTNRIARSRAEVRDRRGHRAPLRAAGRAGGRDRRRRVGRAAHRGPHHLRRRQARALRADITDRASVRAPSSTWTPTSGVSTSSSTTAGVAHVGTVETTAEEDFDRVYRVNVKGLYLCTPGRAAIILKGGGGVILNMASIASLIGIPDASPTR